MADKNIIISLGIMQGGYGGGPPPTDPCLGCDPYGPVSPAEYDNCRTIGLDNYYDQKYHNGCCDFVWVTFEGACP